MNFYLLTYLIHQLLLNFSLTMNNFPDKEKVRWQLACHCIQYLPKRGDLNGRTQKKKRRKIIRSIRFPRYEQKKKKKNTMIIIIKKNDSFEIVRPIYHLHTHAYTHIRVFYSFFIIIIFFFFRPLGVPRRVEKWGSENGKTTKMWHGRWSGLGGTGEGERVGKTSSRRRRMNFNSARAK